jgi:Tfp pilus assembly protein PilE
LPLYKQSLHRSHKSPLYACVMQSEHFQEQVYQLVLA